MKIVPTVPPVFDTEQFTNFLKELATTINNVTEIESGTIEGTLTQLQQQINSACKQRKTYLNFCARLYGNTAEIHFKQKR